MQKTIRRLGLIGAGSLAALALMATTASAATEPTYTGPYIKSAVSTAGYVTGYIYTGGAATYYAFQYGTTTNYGSQTTTEEIAAGVSGYSLVYFPVTGLKPSTTYHYRLVAKPVPGLTYGYYYASPGIGADATFTTGSAGKISFKSTKITEKSKKGSITVNCSSTIACKGKVTVTTTTKVKGKKKTYTCFSGSFSAKAGDTASASGKIGSECTKLLKAAKKHTIKVSIKATTTTYQATITKSGSLKS